MCLLGILKKQNKTTHIYSNELHHLQIYKIISVYTDRQADLTEDLKFSWGRVAEYSSSSLKFSEQNKTFEWPKSHSSHSSADAAASFWQLYCLIPSSHVFSHLWLPQLLLNNNWRDCCLHRIHEGLSILLFICVCQTSCGGVRVYRPVEGIKPHRSSRQTPPELQRPPPEIYVSFHTQSKPDMYVRQIKRHVHILVSVWS